MFSKFAHPLLQSARYCRGSVVQSAAWKTTVQPTSKTWLQQLFRVPPQATPRRGLRELLLRLIPTQAATKLCHTGHVQQCGYHSQHNSVEDFFKFLDPEPFCKVISTVKALKNHAQHPVQHRCSSVTPRPATLVSSLYVWVNIKMLVCKIS